MKKIKTIQELKRFFKKIIILLTHKEENMTQLKYDGKILQGFINNKEVKVTRYDGDADDLEKACMMALLQSVGYTYSDVKALYRNTQVRWKPKTDEMYYYIADCFEVKKELQLWLPH